jgi:ribonuclease P protein component
VLAAGQRLRRAEEFSAAVRSGERGSRGGLVVHVLVSPAGSRHAGPDEPSSRAGFVVPRAVGPAVTRNRVRRRLRHLLRDRLAALPPGTDIVVRVLPTAASSPYGQLGQDLDAAIDRALKRTTARRSR